MSKYFLAFILLLFIPSAIAGDFQSVMDRLANTSSNANGICEDGENLLIDKDCNLILEDVAAGRVFGYMWFFRLVIFAAIILYIKKSDIFPLSMALLAGLLIYHGAFGTAKPFARPGAECGVFNLGSCFFPQNAFFGWVLVIAAMILIGRYIIGKQKVYKQLGRGRYP